MIYTKGTRCLSRAFESPDPLRVLFPKHCCERNISVTETQVTNSPLCCTETSQSSGFHRLKSLLNSCTYNLSNQTLRHPLQPLKHVPTPSLPTSPKTKPTKKPTQNPKGQKTPNPNSAKQREREGGLMFHMGNSWLAPDHQKCSGYNSGGQIQCESGMPCCEKGILQIRMHKQSSCF